MARPRRAYKRWWITTPLKVTIGVLVGTLVGIALGWGYWGGAQAASTTVVPRPQPTYTSYVPEMPWECHDMLEVADTLYDMTGTSEQATLKAATLAAQGARENSAAKLIEAGRAIEQAQKWGPKVQNARANFLKQYKECAAK